MLKKMLLAVAAMVAAMGMAFAQVDVNKADVAALDGVKGVGPSMSKAILDERAKGELKDWADLQTRVKGMGDKKAAKLSQSGLVVNGKGKEGAAAKPAAARGDKSAAKPADAKTAT